MACGKTKPVRVYWFPSSFGNCELAAAECEENSILLQRYLIIKKIFSCKFKRGNPCNAKQIFSSFSVQSFPNPEGRLNDVRHEKGLEHFHPETILQQRVDGLCSNGVLHYFTITANSLKFFQRRKNSGKLLRRGRWDYPWMVGILVEF